MISRPQNTFHGDAFSNGLMTPGPGNSSGIFQQKNLLIHCIPKHWRNFEHYHLSAQQNRRIVKKGRIRRKLPTLQYNIESIENDPLRCRLRMQRISCMLQMLRINTDSSATTFALRSSSLPHARFSPTDIEKRRGFESK